ncbi:hypothetical protein COOONC_16836 [Cooperia oncophora]
MQNGVVQAGNTTYYVTNEGGTFTVNVTAILVDGLTASTIKEDIVFEPIEEIKVVNIQQNVERHEYTLTWDITGARADEIPTYQVKNDKSSIDLKTILLRLER